MFPIHVTLYLYMTTRRHVRWKKSKQGSKSDILVTSTVQHLNVFSSSHSDYTAAIYRHRGLLGECIDLQPCFQDHSVLAAAFHLSSAFMGIPIRRERSTRRQEAEVKSLDHVVIPAEAFMNGKKDTINKHQRVGQPSTTRFCSERVHIDGVFSQPGLAS
ncbi:hypothetical protein GOODEAATRI_008205 [Goodea atripinnis]|uniref:Uncharacterized protein n=1 Tax=Goodea atripinnis TaxID=208336 RepID=A0ABV0PWB7_9TELE